MEGEVPAVFQEQYDALRQYLEAYLQTQKQQSGSQSTQRASAREKLTKLTKQQFSELATDVYDEMKRRQLNSNDAPFLSVRDDLHAKRNQARQKLATLPTSRFKDLASDVYYEIERRHPGVIKAFEAKFGLTRDTAEENAGESLKSPKGPQDFSSLDNLMADLGNMLLPKNSEEKANGISIESVEKLRNEYEARIESLQMRTGQLEQELNDVRISTIVKLEEQLAAEKKKSDEKDAAYAKLQQDYSKLRTDFEGLQDDFNNQQQIAHDIRAEATNLLAEIKSMTKRNEELTLERDRLLQASGQAVQKAEDLANGGYKQESDSYGALKDVESNSIISKDRITAYQHAVGELLRAARSDTPTSVLVAMKAIVIACKNITEDTEAHENSSASITTQEKDELEDVKNKLSQSLTALMTSAKTHATNFGSIPISYLEESSSNLTETINELVTSLQKSNRSGHENGDNVPQETESYDIDDLKIFLEKQTDSIVQAIQTLLYAMRNQTGAFGEDFKATVSGITGIVENLIGVSKRTLATPSATPFREKGEKILEDLASANITLEQLGISMLNSPQSKTLKQRLASSSYEIAKYVKELISLIGWCLMQTW
ncbi:component of the polarisome [Phlyctochytrium planicorne]|nr:component of the polarisome [Phlyctochytrium planicorne]